ncbi:MAG TPA: nucleotidyl transferase AbiEii/AbiGii toxin family protein [Candidatus Saccharimonadales bacterium]|nr:nucleotidyl transferase AbiEii/AbiGii toxin family protein [Candidatus Saccharimonadales bacterium]
MFQPRFEILPLAQKNLWPKLVEVPRHFVLYGGTALALRLGHRQSLDFDFFSSEAFFPVELLRTLPFLKGAKILQNASQTLTVTLNEQEPVKLSFFGGLSLGRVGKPDSTADQVLNVASLLDLAGTKAAVIAQRAESKDYVDLLEIVNSGIGLLEAMAAARALYGERYNPLMTLKALNYFGDGDLHKLTEQQKKQLLSMADIEQFVLTPMARTSNSIAPL